MYVIACITVAPNWLRVGVFTVVTPLFCGLVFVSEAF
jgi:hypothetical protein